MPGAKIFFGGLGQVAGGLTFAPDFHGVLNRHPFPNVVHGCLLEGMALALEGRFQPFSKGRGFITRWQVAQIEEIAARTESIWHRFYNAAGPLTTEPMTDGPVADGPLEDVLIPGAMHREGAVYY